MKTCRDGALICRSTFLNNRLNQLLDIQRGTETVIQDRTIYEDAHIFAPNLHEMGLMGKRDFDNYFAFFETLKVDGAATRSADLFKGIGAHACCANSKKRKGL